MIENERGEKYNQSPTFQQFPVVSIELIILSLMENVSFADVEEVSLAKIPMVYHFGGNLCTNLARTRYVPVHRFHHQY